jgi:hypothetical protein
MAVQKLRESAKHGLAALFAERAARGGGGNARSTFWKGLDRLDEALVGQSKAKVEEELGAHLNYVARLLGNAECSGSSGQPYMTFTGAPGGVIAVLEAFVRIPAIVSGVVGGAFALAPPLGLWGWQAWKKHRDANRLAHTLGTAAVVQRTHYDMTLDDGPKD